MNHDGVIYGHAVVPEANTPQCLNCGVSLTADDIGIHKKLISRNATSFLCIDCLAKKLGCERIAIEERIEYYRASGNCTLFR